MLQRFVYDGTSISFGTFHFTPATLMAQTAEPIAIGGGRAVRPATLDDVMELRRMICEVIDTSPYYNDEFKTYEKARLSANFLRALISADPWYVPMISFKGQLAGFVLLIPENGVIWASWMYIAPAFRETAIAMAAIGFLIRHFDHGRFHKSSCLVRPENTRAEKVFGHFGYARTALLKNHVFGQDCLLLELPLVRAAQTYDPPLPGRIQVLKLRLLHGFRRGRR